MEFWCDGGLKQICVTDDAGNVYLENIRGTNNENEYRAMILALEKAKDGDNIYADSRMVVNQITKGWRVHAIHLYPLYVKAIKLFKSKRVNIEWVSRSWNRAGWILEGQTGDYKTDRFQKLR